MRKARDMTGWDILAPLLLTFACARHGLEYDQYRGLTCTAVYLLLTTSHAILLHVSSRRAHTILNLTTFVAVAFFPYLKWNGQDPNVAPTPIEPVVAAVWVYLLAAAAGVITLFKAYQYLDLAPHPSTSDDRSHSQLANQGFRSILEQKNMPQALSVWRLVPLTFLGICVFGIGLALPVGPLSDDGMILFMEGGCDWGNSSVFFFSKLGLLVAINAGMLIALRQHFTQARMFIPHFLVAVGLMAVYWNDYYCGITQGTTAQMVAEVAALAALMIAAIPKLMTATPAKKLGVLTLINVWHIAVFEFALLYFLHWTWNHTVAVIILTLLPAAFAAQRRITTLSGI